MHRVETLLDYLSKLDSIKNKPLGGNLHRIIDEKIVTVCNEIEEKLGVGQNKSSNNQDIKITVDVKKFAEALIKREIMRPLD
jgi:hypothetical protein